jgi:hypothetical protein
MATPPAAAPQKTNSIWLWVLGLLAVALVILGAGALVATRFLLRNVQVHHADSTVEINTPVGTLKAARDEHADPGLPVYPGAKLTQPGGSVEISTQEEESVSIISAHYQTIDPIEKVDAWYREHLKAEFKREGPGVMVQKKDVVGVQIRSDDVAYISEKEDVALVVALQRRFNAVEIVLLRAGKQEAQ